MTLCCSVTRPEVNLPGIADDVHRLGDGAGLELVIDRGLASEQHEDVVDVRLLEARELDRYAVAAGREVRNPERAVRARDRRSNGAARLVRDRDGRPGNRRLGRVGDGSANAAESLLSGGRKAGADAEPEHGQKQSDAVETLTKPSQRHMVSFGSTDALFSSIRWDRSAPFRTPEDRDETFAEKRRVSFPLSGSIRLAR